MQEVNCAAQREVARSETGHGKMQRSEVVPLCLCPFPWNF